MVRIGKKEADPAFLKAAEDVICDQWGSEKPHAYIAASSRMLICYTFHLDLEHLVVRENLFYFPTMCPSQFISVTLTGRDRGYPSPKLSKKWEATTAEYYEELLNLHATLREELNEAA